MGKVQLSEFGIQNQIVPFLAYGFAENNAFGGEIEENFDKDAISIDYGRTRNLNKLIWLLFSLSGAN